MFRLLDMLAKFQFSRDKIWKMDFRLICTQICKGSSSMLKILAISSKLRFDLLYKGDFLV